MVGVARNPESRPCLDVQQHLRHSVDISTVVAEPSRHCSDFADGGPSTEAEMVVELEASLLQQRLARNPEAHSYPLIGTRRLPAPGNQTRAVGTRDCRVATTALPLHASSYAAEQEPVRTAVSRLATKWPPRHSEQADAGRQCATKGQFTALQGRITTDRLPRTCALR